MTTLMALKVEANHDPLLDFKIQIWQLAVGVHRGNIKVSSSSATCTRKMRINV